MVPASEVKRWDPMLVFDAGRLRRFAVTALLNGAPVSVRIAAPEEFVCWKCRLDCGLETWARVRLSLQYGVVDFDGPALMRPAERAACRALYPWLIRGAREWVYRNWGGADGSPVGEDRRVFETSGEAETFARRMRSRGYRVAVDCIGDEHAVTATPIHHESHE